LLQKFPARAFAVEAQLEFSPCQDGDEAGIVVMGNAHAALALRAKGPGSQVVFRCNGYEQIIGTLPRSSAKLRVEVEDGGRCSFSLIDDAGTRLASAEEFQAVAGKWIGAKIGLYCLQSGEGNGAGFAEFDYFRFAPIE